MLSKLDGLKPTVLSLVVSGGVFALLMHFQPLWLSKLTLIDYLVYPLLVITALFSAQFNRSRIAILSCLWMLYLATVAYPLPWSKWLAGNQAWLILAGAAIFAMLALIKDRGLLSAHGLVRLVFLGICGGVVFGWLLLNVELGKTLQQNTLWQPVSPHLPQTIPLITVALLLLWRSLRQSNLTHAFLLVTFVLWTANHLQWLAVPWSVMAAALAFLYFLAVSVDSYYLAYSDDLTSLPTRRALNQLALSLGRNYTVAMLDIDHFKKFNDTYGHDIGDQVLKLVAAKLNTVKSGGRVFRYGGEEFTVVFPRKSSEQAQPELDTLRQTIADYKMVIRQPQRSNKKSRQSKKSDGSKTVSVTVSIGFCQRQPKQTFEQALKIADEALYRAKKKGRNNVSA